MNITLYEACDAFMCTILFVLSESLLITLFENLIPEIIEFKIKEKSKIKGNYPRLCLQMPFRLNLYIMLSKTILIGRTGLYK